MVSITLGIIFGCKNGWGMIGMILIYTSVFSYITLAEQFQSCECCLEDCKCSSDVSLEDKKFESTSKKETDCSQEKKLDSEGELNSEDDSRFRQPSSSIIPKQVQFTNYSDPSEK